MEKKRKIAIMGAGPWQMPIYEKAREMGIETYGFAYREGAVAEEIADHYYPISLAEKEQIVAQCRQIGVQGIVTCASDFATEIACYVAEQLGLNTTPYQTINHIHDKAWVREQTSHLTSICHPQTCSGSLDTIEPPVYPCIIKPIHGNGKRGIRIANNPEEMADIRHQTDYQVDEDAIAEQFVVGREYSVESLSYHGRHYVVQVTEKVSDGAPHFVELAHHQPAEISADCRERLTNAVSDILTAVGFTNGASHIELKVTDCGDIYLIDLNPRGGGDYISTHLVPLSTDCDYSRQIILIAMDEFDERVYPFHHKACSGVYFLTRQTAHLLPYFEREMPEVVQREYQRDLSESLCNNDRNGYMIYQSNSKLVL